MIDRKKVADIQTEISDAVRAIAEKHGFRLMKNNCSYDDSALRFSIHVNTTSDKDSFAAVAPSLGFHPDDYGKSFVSCGKTFKIIGLQPNRSKYSVLTESGGKKFSFPATSVQRALGKKLPEGVIEFGKIS